RGIRLSAVWLMHDPAYPESLPAAPLVRYTYTEAGELLAVYDRDYGWSDNGDLVRISGPRQTREYGYSATGRLESVRTLAP
ncbi:hypothetical protein, partial [Escherichia coli]|uniref:hypothetical protein n=1 Tax=Escherichia coli TaxID=562 RepID=UPI0022804A43